MAAEERSRLDRFLATWRALRPLRDRLAPDALLRRAVEALDLDVVLAAGPDGERRRRNLEKALALARTFGERGGTAAELAARLRWLAAQPPREPEADLDDADAVTLLSRPRRPRGWSGRSSSSPTWARRRGATPSRARLDPGGRALRRLVSTPSRPTSSAPRRSRRRGRGAQRAVGGRVAPAPLRGADPGARPAGPLRREGRPRQDGSRTFPGWRGLLEEAVGGEPALVLRIPLAEAATVAHGPPSRRPPAPAAAPPGAVAPPRLAPPAPPASIRLAVTQLAEFARCPRRHHLTRVLGLVEPAGLHGGAIDDDPARATSRGHAGPRHARRARLWRPRRWTSAPSWRRWRRGAATIRPTPGWSGSATR